MDSNLHAIEKSPDKGVRDAIFGEFRLVFMGVIAIVLSLMYIGASFYLIILAFVATNPDVPDGITFVYTTVGGLISATVVAMFAATPKGQHPVSQIDRHGVEDSWSDDDWGFDPNWDDNRREAYKRELKGERERALRSVISVYVWVWILLGGAALVVGVMIRPDVVSVLSDAGTTWLGIAVASVYAYLGIAEPGRKDVDKAPPPGV
jgi:hypothetical protein